MRVSVVGIRVRTKRCARAYPSSFSVGAGKKVSLKA